MYLNNTFREMSYITKAMEQLVKVEPVEYDGFSLFNTAYVVEKTPEDSQGADLVIAVIAPDYQVLEAGTSPAYTTDDITVDVRSFRFHFSQDQNIDTSVTLLDEITKTPKPEAEIEYLTRLGEALNSIEKHETMEVQVDVKRSVKDSVETDGYLINIDFGRFLLIDGSYHYFDVVDEDREED